MVPSVPSVFRKGLYFKESKMPVFLGGALAVLIGLFLASYWADSADRLPISTTTDANWSQGVYRHNAPAILVDYSPYAEAITPGSYVTFDNEETRRVAKIVGAAGPYWEIWLEGDPFTGQTPRTFTVADGPSPLLLFLVGFFISLILAIGVTGGAYLVLRSGTLFARSPGLLAYGVSFFLGMSFLLLSWRGIAALSGSATLGLFATILIGLVYAGWRLWRDISKRAALLEVLTYSLLFALLSFGFLIYFIFFWVAPDLMALDFSQPSLPLGPFESGQYGNIASLILQTDHIPALRQNYGQSILSAMPGFFGLHTPRLSLISWLAISVAALVLLTAGFVAQLGFNRKAQVFVVLIILLAGPRLTFITAQLTDNHSAPVLYNAYADTILGIGTLFAGLLCLALPGGKFLPRLISFFLLATLWSLCGLQFAAVFLFFCGMTFVLGLRRFNKSWRLTMGAALAVAAGLAVTLPLGGMLTPEHYQPPISLPGFYPAPSVSDVGIDILFRSSHILFSDPYIWKYVGGGYSVAWQKLSWESVENIYKNISLTEAVATDLLRSLFFIICGLSFYLYRRSPDRIENAPLERAMAGWVVCSLVVGLFFAHLLLLNDIWKELLRFMNPAYFFGMVLFGLGIYQGLGAQRLCGARLMNVLLVLLSMAGPVVGILLQILGSYANLSIAQKVNILMSVPPLTSG